MKHRRYEVKTYYSVPICDNCGNDLDDTHGLSVLGEVLTTYPPQKQFRCNTCGVIYTLTENEWPKMEYDIVKVEEK